MRGFLFLFIAFSAIQPPLYALQPSVTEIPFYSETLYLQYDAAKEIPWDEATDADGIRDFVRQAEQVGYHDLLLQLESFRSTYHLNDWFYYELIRSSVQKLFPEHVRNYRVLMEWLLLKRSGIEARVFGVGDRFYTHALTSKAHYGFYTIEVGSESFLNLTAFVEGADLNGQSAILHEFVEDSQGRAFGLEPGKLPAFASTHSVEREIRFTHQEEETVLKVLLNADHIRMMDTYPHGDREAYFNVHLSPEAQNSLYPALKKGMEGMDMEESVAYLLSFTRTSFTYRHDRLEYGYEKPMTAEQTLFYSVSDCEDRSALFYRLVRDLLDLPLIVLDFETHVGVAIDLGEHPGQTFLHKGRTFVYCEPTGPQDHLQIGEMWEKIKGQKFRILTEYIPAQED